MIDPAIRVENISKAYRIGLKEQRHDTLGATIAAWVKSPLKNFKQLRALSNFNNQDDDDIFWALKNISFEIKKGEVLAVIGKNGAGKSTLLKILSRITEPTDGRVEIYGRVASLLEVGTGFNPELSGRENVYLNGTILGMTKKEIDKKFEGIIAFSGVEKFIDTPVKRYSSGMKVRLAFAVAAHLDPEILIIDEVLAVGDSEFQKKCLGKMGELSQGQGRTVLFVSHNMAAVRQLCKHGIVMDNGKLVFAGSVNDAVNFYQISGKTNTFFEHIGLIEDAPGNECIKLLKVEVIPTSNIVLSISSGFTIELKFFNHKRNINLAVGVILKTLDEVIISELGCILTQNRDSQEGIYILKYTIPDNLLNSGHYYLDLLFGEDQRYILYTHKQVVQFEILNESIGSNSYPLPGFLRLSKNAKFQFIGKNEY